MEDEKYWAERYERVTAPPIQPVLVGFNVNLDQIIPVTKELLDSAGLRTGDLADLRSHLIHSMEHCTAEEWFVADPVKYARFMEYFSGTGSLAMGGQAGIAALHLAALGAPEVFCLAPALGRNAAEMLNDKGVRIPGSPPNAKACPDAIHLIFEYKPGLVPLAGGALPRNNRFIVSPKKTAENTLMKEKSLRAMLLKAAPCTRAFLSGYQYLHTEDEFCRAADQIRAIRTINHRMRVHIECVSVTDASVVEGLVHHILPAADSAGMNEHELSLMPGQDNDKTPAGMAQGILSLARTTGLARIHLHTFGYYLQVIRKDRAIQPERSLAALLNAAGVVARAAGGTGTRVSREGIGAVMQLEEVFGPGQDVGIFSSGDYFILAVPTLIASEISKTSGLGDILSSTAFVADQW
jgi:ADP-dependent phosphofructokinase/glucokinase